MSDPETLRFRKYLGRCLLALPILVIIALVTWCSGDKSERQETVWICTGKTARTYHLQSDCMGLSNCKGARVRTNKIEAEKKGRSLCRRCAKKSKGKG